MQHRRFADELVALDRKADALKGLNIPWLAQPVETTLDGLFNELDMLWCSFDRELRQGKLKHLDFDTVKKSLTWHRPKADQDTIRVQRAEAAVAHWPKPWRMVTRQATPKVGPIDCLNVIVFSVALV